MLRIGEAGGFLRNLMSGDSRGAEFALRREPAPPWRLNLAYTYLTMQLQLDPDSTSNPAQLDYIERLAPQQQASPRVDLDLSYGRAAWQF